MNKFLIGTGYVNNAKTPIRPSTFFEYWMGNTSKVKPEKIFVAANQSLDCDVDDDWPDWHVYPITNGDLGHIRDKHEGRSNYPFTGWAGGMLMAAMAAYNECLDFIYKEQDCLAFGDWVGQLYRDMGDGDAVLGRGLRPPHNQLKSSQSLFLVRHEQIPWFIMRYLSCGEDTATGSGTGENKFRRMIDMDPKTYREQSGWNFDRDRPLPNPLPSIFALQQITTLEFKHLKQLNLV